MPARPGPPDAPSKLRRAVGTAGITLSLLIAVGVAALFLTLLGPARTGHSDAPDSHRVRTQTLVRHGDGGTKPRFYASRGEPGAPATSTQETHRRVREPHIRRERALALTHHEQPATALASFATLPLPDNRGHGKAPSRARTARRFPPTRKDPARWEGGLFHEATDDPSHQLAATRPS